MAYCGNCGHPLDDGTGYCSYCGAEHSADGEAVLPAGAATEPGPSGTVTIPASSQGAAPAPAQSSRALPQFRTETTVPSAGSAASPAAGQSGKSKGKWMLLVAVLVIVAACASVIAMLFLRDGGSGASAAGSASPSPSATAHAVVKIMSPSRGNKVIGGQPMRVAVLATGVDSLQGMQLTVNGEPTGPTKIGTGTEGNKTVSFPWRPPAKGGNVVLGVQAIMQDGSVVPSKTVRVAVRPATVPTPTVTVTAQAQPTYGSSGSSGADSGGSDKGDGLYTPCWVVLISSETNRTAAEQWRDTLFSYGWENAGILLSDNYPASFRAGFYCPYVGPYDYESDARDALRALKADHLGEQPRTAYVE